MKMFAKGRTDEMKGILEFDLPEDEDYFKVASMARDLWLALYKFNESLAGDAFAGIKEMLWAILDEYNITLEELP